MNSISDRFEQLFRAGREALARGDATAASTALRTALGLWRGPALADVLEEPFAAAESGRLEERRLLAIEERIEADLALGAAAELVPELEAAGARPAVSRAAARPAHARSLSGGAAGRGAVAVPGLQAAIRRRVGPRARAAARRATAQDPQARLELGRVQRPRYSTASAAPPPSSPVGDCRRSRRPPRGRVVARDRPRHRRRRAEGELGVATGGRAGLAFRSGFEGRAT